MIRKSNFTIDNQLLEEDLELQKELPSFISPTAFKTSIKIFKVGGSLIAAAEVNNEVSLAVASAKQGDYLSTGAHIYQGVSWGTDALDIELPEKASAQLGTVGNTLSVLMNTRQIRQLKERLKNTDDLSEEQIKNLGQTRRLREIELIGNGFNLVGNALIGTGQPALGISLKKAGSLTKIGAIWYRVRWMEQRPVEDLEYFAKKV